MNGLTIWLLVSSVVAYAIALVLIVRRRWQAYAGFRALNVAAALAFVLARLFPQSVTAAMLASIVIAAALVLLTRRSTLLGAILTAVPLLAMLCTIDRAFFNAPTADEFQAATIALLCAPGPVLLCAWLISLSRRTPGYPKTSSR